jgi:hypothetical protein
MKRWIAALLFVLSLPVPASAQAPGEAPKFGVLSLISDAYAVVTYDRGVGRLTDANFKEAVTLSERVFDDVVLVAANETLKGRTQPKEIAFLSAGVGTAYPEASRLFDGSRFLPPEWLAQALATQKVPRLILVTKHKADTDIGIHGEVIGSGKLEGLGFYVDRSKFLRHIESGDIVKGYLAPFAYLRVSLIDVPTMTVVAQQPVTASTIVAPRGPNAGADPWEAVTPIEKLQALERLVKEAIDTALPQLLPAPPTAAEALARG